MSDHPSSGSSLYLFNARVSYDFLCGDYRATSIDFRRFFDLVVHGFTRGLTKKEAEEAQRLALPRERALRELVTPKEGKLGPGPNVYISGLPGQREKFLLAYVEFEEADFRGKTMLRIEVPEWHEVLIISTRAFSDVPIGSVDFGDIIISSIHESLRLCPDTASDETLARIQAMLRIPLKAGKCTDFVTLWRGADLRRPLSLHFVSSDGTVRVCSTAGDPDRKRKAEAPQQEVKRAKLIQEDDEEVSL